MLQYPDVIDLNANVSVQGDSDIHNGIFVRITYFDTAGLYML